jgi:hypothetical protein
MHGQTALGILVVLAFSDTVPVVAQHSRGPVDRLGWIAGCWRQSGPSGSNRVTDEQWMAPRGRTMLGMSRTVRDDSVLVELEQLQILERNGRAVYHAQPSGQTAADFEARDVSDTLVTFENSKHDFPQRIIYRRRGADSLIARIEGTRNERLRGIDFPYARVACP